MRFRPCIDLHDGKVKQIVGGTLKDNKASENFTSKNPSSHYAKLYRKDGLQGAHVIMLGPNNKRQAEDAIKAWPGGLQIGGGMDSSNAAHWIELGASDVIFTSFLFENKDFSFERLKELNQKIKKDQIVIDLSCRKKNGKYYVVTNKWQHFTNFEVNSSNLEQLADYCNEFLIHGVDVEGLSLGIEENLVTLLADSKVQSTYAGGISSIEDIGKIKTLGRKKVNFTVGSALDIFGGSKLKYAELVELNKNNFVDI